MLLLIISMYVCMYVSVMVSGLDYTAEAQPTSHKDCYNHHEVNKTLANDPFSTSKQ